MGYIYYKRCSLVTKQSNPITETPSIISNTTDKKESPRNFDSPSPDSQHNGESPKTWEHNQQVNRSLYCR